MTDNQIKAMMTVLERIANALEAQAGMQLRATEPLSEEQAIGIIKKRIMEPIRDNMIRADHEHNSRAEETEAKPFEAIPYDTVRKALLHFQDTKGAAAAQNVLKSFGVKYIMELKATPEKYAEVLGALQ